MAKAEDREQEGSGLGFLATLNEDLLTAALDGTLRDGELALTGPVLRGDAGTVAEHVASLVALAAEGSFTDAAIALGVGQSAVSRTLAQLERIVGVVLVHRTTRSVTLTPAGEAARAAAVDALRALDAVADAATGRSRPLRIGYSWAALGRYTTDILRTWREQCPDRPLEVHRIDERLAGLRTGVVDLAVIRGERPTGALRTQLLFTEGRVAAVPAGHPLASAAAVSLAVALRPRLFFGASAGTGAGAGELRMPSSRSRITV